MKKILAIILVLASVTTLLACNKVEQNATPEASLTSVPIETDNIATTSVEATTNVSKNEALTKQQMLDDFDDLWNTLQANYPYFNILKRMYVERSLSSNYAEECYEKYRLQVENMNENEEFSDIMFAQIIEQFLMDMAGGTAHLGIIAPSQIPMMSELYNMEDTKVWHDTLTEKEVADKNIYFSSQLEMFRATKSPVQENETSTNTEDVAAESLESSNLEMKIMEDGKTAYIKINSFDNELMAEEVPQILAFYETIQEYQDLIIDLTENSGGNIQYWMDAIVSPNITEDLTVTHDFMMTDGAVAEKFRGEQYKNTGITVEDIKNNPQYVNLKIEDLENLSLARTDEFTVPSENHKKLFNGKIWMLTSPNVYSASEKLVSFSKDTGFATLVGQVTHGEGIGGDPVLYPLPNSKMVIRFNVEYCLNHDGSSNQEIGTTPDVLADNTLEACLIEIEKSR